MLLVTRATGNIGRELARELDARGAGFRVLVRDPARAAGLPASAERITGDLDDPATLEPALAGAGKLFLLAPGIGTSHVRHAVAAARAADVTIAQQVRILSAATGLDIKVREPATPEEAARARFPNGAPPALAEAFLEAIALMRADTTGLRTDTVQRLLGRKPATFTDWCARNASRFQQAVTAN